VTTRSYLTLIFIPKQPPAAKVGKVRRLKITNMLLHEMFPVGGTFCKSIEEFLNIDVSKSLIYPPQREWNSEYYTLRKKLKNVQSLVKNKCAKIVNKSDLVLALDQEFQEMLKLERSLHKVVTDFELTAIKCIELINKWKVKPHELKYLYGTGGAKYVMAGMLIRECTAMYAFGQKFTALDQVVKLAKHKVKMLNHARENQEDIFVPLCSLIEYYGTYFVVHATEKVELDTLVYGSITQDLLIKNDLNLVKSIETLSELFNCSFHKYQERGITLGEKDQMKEMFLSSGVEIHKINGKLYLTDLERLTPLEIGHADPESHVLGTFVNFLSLNLVLKSHGNQISSEYRLVKSRLTVKCKECDQYIPDEEYFTYHKSALIPSSKAKVDYDCCLQCYREKAFLHQLKISINKLKKKRFRAISIGEFYIHKGLGTFSESVPYRKIPVNPDVTHLVRSKNFRKLDVIRKNDLDLVKSLVGRMRDIMVNQSLTEIEQMEVEIGDGADLSRYLKQQGISMRILGRFCEMTETNYLKEQFVREIIARSAANVLRSSFGYLKNLSNKMNEFNLKKSLCFHLNNIFGSAKESEESKAERKAILDYVQIKFSIRLENDVFLKIHSEGLAVRIIQLVRARLLVKLTDVNFYDRQPFLPHFFEFDQPFVMNSPAKSISIKFLERLGEEHRSYIHSDAWWIESGVDTQLAIFFFNHANQFQRIVKHLFQTINFRLTEKTQPNV